ncbi:DeoR-family transcriptional regulator [Escherichia coli]|uniref:DeoR-family transcriptional regulator n=1 Tax=Escherichia coli TaxID=562 RepID=A0A376U1E4_ECOLX|nr:DeoR-family transcriptional regulator [Escherichia coli]
MWTVEKVVERLGISPATARRDINKLDESGKLKKVRNGAEAITQQRPRWTPMNLHQAQNHDEKVRIAKAASQLVNPGESVVIKLRLHRVSAWAGNVWQASANHH